MQLQQLTLLLLGVTVAIATVRFSGRSAEGNYKIRVKSVEASNLLFDRVPGLRDICADLTASLHLNCEGITKTQSMMLLQEDELVIFIDVLPTIHTSSMIMHSKKKRSTVPWNLDRINQRNGALDYSYKDNADVNVYILGHGINVAHSEFENRASIGYSAFDDDTDCSGIGTPIASLVGGRTVGIARAARIISVKVVDCDSETNEAKIINGISYIEDAIQRTADSVRSVVLVGFTIKKQRDINDKLIDLTEAGILVVGAAGENDDYNACQTTPASAQGVTAMDGVVTVGGTDQYDQTVSNLGECVDLFAPAENIPAAAASGPTDMTLCQGSVCSAALAAGVVANSLRQNSKISLEVQKSMLINGATNTLLHMPERSDEDVNTDSVGRKALLLLKARTPQKLLYSTCGYYRSEEPPVCESYTAECNNSKITTFDGNSVPLYQQKYERCGFIVFTSEENRVKVEGSYHKCTLGAYRVEWRGVSIALIPGPTVILNGAVTTIADLDYNSPDMEHEDNFTRIAHVVDMGAESREPLVVIALKDAEGEDEIKMEYDGTSRLQITLLKPDKYKSGNTGGLCGLFDRDGTNDYQLPNSTRLNSYSTQFHTSWSVHNDSTCTDACNDGACTCENTECSAAAESFCKDKFAGASEECLAGVNAFKELQSCVETVSKCCCQATADSTSKTMPDLNKVCCQNSFFGNFERNRAGCKFCDNPSCTKEKTEDNCVDDSLGRIHYDYLDRVKYSPVNSCYFIPSHDTQICTAPRNSDKMWSHNPPTCQEKRCSRPVLPNTETLISPDKTEYSCGETVTVTCTWCHEITPSQQVIECKPGASEGENDAQWSADVLQCTRIMCPDPDLPKIDDDKNVKYPLSWRSGPTETDPWDNKCGDTAEFGCDTCYEKVVSSDTECQETGTWTPSPSCQLRYCEDPNTPSLDYPLEIKVENRACNDTIEYQCRTRPEDPIGADCYDLVGDSSSTCHVTDDNVMQWSNSRPSCDIRHCDALRTEDLAGNGWYQFDNAGNESIRVELTNDGSNSPTECGSQVQVVCDDCSYLCGDEWRTCQANKGWSGTRPRCAVRKCAVPDNAVNETHAVYTPSRDSYQCGEAVTFSCQDDCHEYVTGSEEHRCIPDKPEGAEPTHSSAMWEGDAFSCTIKECPALTAPDNGSISTTKTTCGTLTLVTCDPCYELVGSNELKCLPNKTWTHDMPTCVMKTCPKPGQLPNGNVIARAVNKCGDRVEYSCDKCFYLEGENAATCETDRSWSSPVPTCTQWTCPGRDHPRHGNISSTAKTPCGGRVEYTCDFCYQLVGEGGAECQHQGAWSVEQPVCELKTCSRPTVPNNTRIVPDKDTYDCGDIIKVECDTCYECTEKQSVQCLDGGWERAVPECNIKTCQPPGPLQVVKRSGLLEDDDEGPDSISWPVEDPGYFKDTEGGLVDEPKCGDELEWTCDECYNLRGDNSIRCLNDKSWTDKPYCELKTCSQPETLTEHLVITNMNDTYACKDTIHYDCDDTCWSLEGSPKRECSPTVGSNITTWTPQNPPKCKIKTCLPPILDDLVSVTGLYTCNSTITFSCPPCYRLDGAKTATCLDMGDWDVVPPTCEAVCCPELPVLRSGDPSYDVEIMSYTHTVRGESLQTLICGSDHVCQKVDVTCQECYEYVTEAGDVYSTAPTRECTHPGVWTNVAELCTRKQCPVRELMKEHRIAYTEQGMEDRVSCGDKVEFQCDACHENLEGGMTQECLPTKQWSHPDVPTCSLKECPELPWVHDSCSFGDSQHRTCGTRRQLECDSCFYTDKCHLDDLKDISMTCGVNKTWQWQQSVPVVKIKTCDAPPHVEHASFVSDGDGYTCGRVVKYECDECYEFVAERECNCATVRCVGDGASDNCTRGTWDGKFPECTLKTCDPLEIPAHATVVANGSNCLATFHIECDVGYELVAGDPIRTCQTNQEWTGSPPVCQIRNCTQLDAPLNGAVSTMDRHYGTVVTFSCDECYTFPESMTDPEVLMEVSHYPRYHILMCEAHGNWNGSEPVCQRKYCGKPPIPGNADLLDSDFYCGDVVAYTCNTGYFQSGGTRSRTCGTDSQWDGSDFECSVKTCEIPRHIDNGEFSPVLDRYVYKSSVTYDCDYCHQAVGKLEITCEDNSETDSTPDANWKPESLPTCSRIQCPEFETPRNIKLNPMKPQLAMSDCGQIIDAECDTGYRLVGPHKTMFCQSGGGWSGATPTCTRMCCPRRQSLENGDVEQLNDAQCYGDKVKLTCDSCHEMVTHDNEVVSHVTHTCEADGMWSEELPNCRRVKCPRIRFAKGSFTDSSYSGYCGSTRTFTCYQGYTLKGSASTTCLESGQWSAPAPTCEPNSCPSTGLDIDHGIYIPETISVELATQSPGETPEFLPLWTLVYFECNSGYELHGNREIFCGVEGKWSGVPPKCTKEVCPLPETPPHGSVNTTHLKEGGVATYTCNECYRLDGYTSLRCMDGEWFPQSVPSCVENLCYPPGEEENSFIVGYDPEKIRYKCGETVEYGCDEGHVLHGVKTRTCSESGQWSGVPPVCADIECPRLPHVENGGMKRINGSDHVNFWCEKGYQMSGDSQLLCVKGQWQGVEPRCAKQVCGDPGTPDWGSKEGDVYDYGSSVTFSCNQGYQMRGSPVITCNHKGEWDYSPPYCVCNECPRLSQPVNGYIITSDSNSYLSTVQYVCHFGYEVVGQDTRVCGADGSWSGEQPTCQRVNCTENYQIPQGGEVVAENGRSYKDMIQIKCPNKKGSWWRTCQADGIWSGFVPERCDCRIEVRTVQVLHEVVQPAACFLGRCTEMTVRNETGYVQKEFSVCD